MRSTHRSFRLRTLLAVRRSEAIASVRRSEFSSSMSACRMFGRKSIASEHVGSRERITCLTHSIRHGNDFNGSSKQSNQKENRESSTEPGHRRTYSQADSKMGMGSRMLVWQYDPDYLLSRWLYDHKGWTPVFASSGKILLCEATGMMLPSTGTSKSRPCF